MIGILLNDESIGAVNVLLVSFPNMGPNEVLSIINVITTVSIPVYSLDITDVSRYFLDRTQKWLCGK